MSFTLEISTGQTIGKGKRKQEVPPRVTVYYDRAKGDHQEALRYAREVCSTMPTTTLFICKPGAVDGD